MKYQKAIINPKIDENDFFQYALNTAITIKQLNKWHKGFQKISFSLKKMNKKKTKLLENQKTGKGF